MPKGKRDLSLPPPGSITPWLPRTWLSHGVGRAVPAPPGPRGCSDSGQQRFCSPPCAPHGARGTQGVIPEPVPIPPAPNAECQGSSPGSIPRGLSGLGGARRVLTWESSRGGHPASEGSSPGPRSLRLQPVGELGGVVPAALLVPCGGKGQGERLRLGLPANTAPQPGPAALRHPSSQPSIPSPSPSPPRVPPGSARPPRSRSPSPGFT